MISGLIFQGHNRVLALEHNGREIVVLLRAFGEILDRRMQSRNHFFRRTVTRLANRVLQSFEAKLFLLRFCHS